VQKIKKLKYHQIDFNKYNRCIEKATNKRIEAFSWYLDIVTDKKWEVLVLNDYQAVLPLPMFRIKKRWFKKMVTQPLFCQQLGLFYSKIEPNEIHLFIDIIKTLPIFQYHFNHYNDFILTALKDKIHLKNNFVLDLYQNYITINKKYKKRLKRNLKKAQKAQLTIQKNVSFKEFKKLKKENSNHKIKDANFKIMEALTVSLIQKNSGNFYGVYQQEELISVAFYIKTKNRIIYLFSATSSLGKKTGATAFLMDYIIQNNCNQPKTLDFEGSNIKGIATFFKTFGSTNQPYYALINH